MVDQFRSLYKKSDELTSTSPIGVHIGHYIVATESSDITSIITQCINIPIMGNPPKLQTSIHTMIPKDTGCLQIGKLRIIQLLEPDYNEMTKIKINKELMNHTETTLILGNDIHGGRKQCTSHDTLLTQQLIINIEAQQHRPVTILNLDDSKCYNRIFPNVDNIALQRLVLSMLTTNKLTKPLIQMKHHIKTAYGISQNHIQLSNNEILSGMGQGCTEAGPEWLAVESILLQALTEFAPKTVLMDPSHLTCFSSQINGYIDYNNFIIVHPHTETVECNQRTSNEILNSWDKLLQETGGKLRVNKCATYSWS